MIRAATTQDTDAIIDVWLAASRESHAFVTYDVWLSHVDAMRDVYLPDSETYVFCNEPGSVVGFVSLAGDDLAALFVDPIHQSQGIGSSLLRHAQSLRENLRLCVYVDNPRAAAFYRRHGFDPVSEGVDERTGQRETCMTWSTIA